MATRKDAAAARAPARDGLPPEGRQRVVVEAVAPDVDQGAFPAKRIAGDEVTVEADVFADGHDRVRAVVRFLGPGARQWQEAPMEPLGNDRWRGAFPVDRVGVWRFTVAGWADRWGTWRHDLEKRVEAGQRVDVDLVIGGDLVAAAAKRARGHAEAAALLQERARALRDRGQPEAERVALALDAELDAAMLRFPDRALETVFDRELEVMADPPRARASAWYELFPRSASAEPGRHGTLKDVEARLPYVAGMGFDVLYLPPIHPIGKAFRKGPNNHPQAGPGDAGSPWAIGSEEGGHTAVHPELGSIKDFESLLRSAKEHGLDVAMDLAFQCAPDHPWVREHPQWFRVRPDGTIQYAENPPKKYQDIVPIDFECADWRNLWRALKGVVDFWIERGVTIFRVDNPHTKPFAFWAWLIGEVRRGRPDVLFLAEAFTRPKVMYRLAKLGFTHSYTYFAWRNSKWDLEQYLNELTQGPPREFFRRHFWPNTPDILTEQLHTGGRASSMARLVLAATMSANYGIYGPPFELVVNQPVRPGSEEYLDSEKYQVRHWDLDDPGSLREFITLVNHARRENPALLHDGSLRFHGVDNEHLIAYSKRTPDRKNVILTVVNLDPHHTQHGWTHLDLGELGVDPDHQFQVHDLLTGARYLWQGPRNYVELNPHSVPAHILRVRHRVHTEQDFDYFM